MNENNEQIAALLAEIRDTQRESLELQKANASRIRKQVRFYYISSAILLPILIFLLLRSF